MGSACRCTTFQEPSSGLRVIVTRRSHGVTSSLPPTFAVGALYPQNAGKLRSHVLRYGLEVVDLTISEYGCSTVLGLRNLRPSERGRAEGVGEGYVFSVGEKLLYRLWVPFDELLARLLELFEYSVEIIYRSQLEITSIV
jgi:hypothetical protein